MTILSSLLFKDYRRRVLELLLLHADESFHVREIARLTGTVAGTLHKELAKLAAAGILLKKSVGNQVQYRANTDCLIFKELKQIIEKTSDNNQENGKVKMDDIVEKNRQQILILAKKNGVRNVRVFGSMARNDARPDSDLDLLVELEEGKSGFALGGFLHDVSNLVHRKVDVVTEKSLHPSLRDKVLHEANVL